MPYSPIWLATAASWSASSAWLRLIFAQLIVTLLTCPRLDPPSCPFERTYHDTQRERLLLRAACPQYPCGVPQHLRVFAVPHRQSHQIFAPLGTGAVCGLFPVITSLMYVARMGS